MKSKELGCELCGGSGRCERPAAVESLPHRDASNPRRKLGRRQSTFGPVILGLLAMPEMASAAIVFDGTFARHDFSAYYRLQATGQVVNADDYPGGFNGRFELTQDPAGDQRVGKVTLHPRDPPTSLGLRSEFATNSERLETERWYSWAYLVPNVWEPGTVVISQIHDSPDVGEYASHGPTLTFAAQANGMVRISNSYDRNAVTTPSSYETRELASYSLELGQWTNIVLHARWSAGDTGFLDIYKDGALIFSERDHPNTFNDAHGPYFKQGLYAHSPFGPEPRTLYSSGLMIGDAGESLASMAMTPIPEPSRVALVLVGSLVLLTRMLVSGGSLGRASAIRGVGASAGRMM